MPERTLAMDDTFNFSIIDTSAHGNLKAVDAFLSESKLEEEEGDGITEIDPEEERKEQKKQQLEAARKAAEAKRKAEADKKKAAEQLFLSGDEEEEEEGEPKEGDDKPKEEGEAKEEEGGNTYESFAKDLVNLGVLTQEEGEEPPKTGEELLAKFQREKQAGAVQWLNGFLSKFGDDRQELFQAIFVDGVEPKEYLPLYVQIENMESLDLEKEDNQEMVFREFYRRIKLPTDRIESKLQKAKDNGDLEADAKEFHTQLVEQDKEAAETNRAQKAAKQQAEQRIDAEYKASLSKALMEKVKAKEINGIPITQEIANKAFDFLHTKKYKTTDGQFLTEFDKFVLESKRPENIDTRLMIALLKLSNFDFSKITKRAVSKQSNELFSTFAQRQSKKTAASGKQEASSSTQDWLSL